MDEEKKNKIVITDLNQDLSSDIKVDLSKAKQKIESIDLKLKKLEFQSEQQKVSYQKYLFLGVAIGSALFFILLFLFIIASIFCEQPSIRDIPHQRWYAIALILVTVPSAFIFALLKYEHKTKSDKESLRLDFTPSQSLIFEMIERVIDIFKKKK